MPIPFNDPEIKEVFTTTFNNLVNESDRGAVLIAASVIDSFLRKLFERILPAGMDKDTRRRLLNYPGPLSSMAAKADIAYAVRIIPKDLHVAIHILRKIRNDVAHTPDSFSLEDHRGQLEEMSKFSQGLSELIAVMTFRSFMNGLISTVMQGDEAKAPDERLFASPEEIQSHIAENPSVRKIIEQKQLRSILASTLTVMCTFMVLYWKQAESALPGDKLIF